MNDKMGIDSDDPAYQGIFERDLYKMDEIKEIDVARLEAWRVARHVLWTTNDEGTDYEYGVKKRLETAAVAVQFTTDEVRRLIACEREFKRDVEYVEVVETQRASVSSKH